MSAKSCARWGAAAVILPPARFAGADARPGRRPLHLEGSPLSGRQRGLPRAGGQKYPQNSDYRVRWGRLYLDHLAARRRRRLFNEALTIKKDHAGALLGLALIAAEIYDGKAAELAHKALEADPKLLEAQELLARLALEDNNNAQGHRGSQEGARHRSQFRCRPRRFWPPSTGWPTRRRRPGIRTTRAATRPPAISSSSTAATRKPSSTTARPSRSTRSSTARAPQLGINLMRLGQDARSLPAARRPASTTDSRTSATNNSLT